jgi:hypothetical protein
VRKLLIVLAILLALFLAADFGTRLLADSWVSRGMKSALDFSERPDVSVGGFPFIPHLLAGSFPSVKVTGRGLTTGAVTFRSVALTLRGVRASPLKLARGRGGTIRVEEGEGSATITDGAITSALRRKGFDVEIRFDGGGVVLHSEALGGDVRVLASVKGRTLVLRSADPRLRATFSVELPEIVPGLSFTGVRVGDSVAVLSFRLHRTTLTVPSRSGASAAAESRRT